MRLLTHNLLVCNVKACVETASRDVSAAKNFPLKVGLLVRRAHSARIYVSAIQWR